MSTVATPGELTGAELDAWRHYLRSHACIMRELDAEIVREHGITTRDYEVLLHLSWAEHNQLGMSELAEATMLTRSGITRLVDGLQKAGLVKRCPCPRDARVSYAKLTPAGLEKLRAASFTHVEGIRRTFLANFSPAEVQRLAELLGRLRGGPGCPSCTPG